MLICDRSLDKPKSPKFCMVHHIRARGIRSMANISPESVLQAEIPHRLRFFRVLLACV